MKPKNVAASIAAIFLDFINQAPARFLWLFSAKLIHF